MACSAILYALPPQPKEKKKKLLIKFGVSL